VASQPRSDKNDDNGHDQGQKETDFEHQKDALEATETSKAENKPLVSTEPFSEKEAQKQHKAATVIQSVCRGYQ
jgi:hypothetical protein